MNKAAFLKDTDVNSFVEWLEQQLDNKKLTHHYAMPGGNTITFNGLDDALAQYDWPFRYRVPPAFTVIRGHTFSDNNIALTALCAGLSVEVTSLNDPGVRDWAIAVMEWGGVRNGNVTWLNGNVIGLAAEISAAKALLLHGNDDKRILRAIRRFNAGMTKVYSLLVQDFIIYDSRVAAALAWLVIRWCQETNRLAVPNMVCFPCMRPKQGDNPAIRKIRNPSCGNYSFPWMNNNRTNHHAHWNMRASWILFEALRLSRSRGTLFHKQSQPLRSLEAALFMWGYDLSRNSPCGTYGGSGQEQVVDIEPEIDNAEPQESEWNHSMTLGGGNAAEFHYRFDEQSDSIVIKRANGTCEYFKSGEIFQIIHVLYDIFGSDCFPLANSLTNMPNGTEKPGLGSTIYSSGKGNVSHAQAASQLGVVLMELGIFERCDQPGIAWRICIEPPSTIEDLRMFF